MKRVILKYQKDAPVRRFHPWIFSGAIHKIEGKPKDGDIVEVYSGKGDYLATGHFQDSSIKIRIISFQQIPIDINFWEKKLKNAYAYRQQLELVDNTATSCYRLIHAEGDGLPGLIIDIYGTAAVVQCHSIGMHHCIDDISTALQNVYSEKLETIFDKSKASLPKDYGEGMENKFLFGDTAAASIQENDNTFWIDWEQGQKTGFFIDQRANRDLLATYSKGKKVLNAFCYSGGFSIYALNAGAKSVHSMDISQKAIDWTNKNADLNAGFAGTHEARTEDVMQYLKQHDEMYDIVVIDPPAFAKSLKKRHNAVQAYKRLNIQAMNRVVEGGLLFTFSCSQVVDRALFDNTIVAAALEVGRSVRIMHRLSQAADHPVNIYHPESNYLKGLVLRLD